MLAGASLETEASSSNQLSAKSSNHSGRSRKGLPRARLRVLQLRVVAGGVESSRVESCDTDVEDVLVDEPESPFEKPKKNDRRVILLVAS